MERKKPLSHDALDALVATIIGWCERLGHRSEPTGDFAFNDEWERKQMLREMHGN